MRLALAGVLAACGAPSPPVAPIAGHAPQGQVLQVWRAVTKTDPFGAIGNVVVSWDSTRGGIVERSATTGTETGFRRIEGSHTNGTPEVWQPTAAGIVTGWGGGSDLTLVHDRNGVLSVGWSQADDWWGSPYVTIGTTLWGARARTHSALEAVDLADGSVRWLVKFPDDAQDVKVGGDATTIMLARERYMVTPPNGAGDIHRVIAAFDAKTGAARWQNEIPIEPNSVEVGSGGAIAALDDSLLLFDAATGHVAKRPFAHTYPSMLVDQGLAFVIDDVDKLVTAYRLVDGSTVWSIKHTVGHGSHLAAHDDLVIMTTEAGTALALDRGSGAVRWEVGTGVVATKLAVTDAAVVMFDDHEVGGFALPRSTPAQETATIHGIVRRVECGTVKETPINVGGHEVSPDANGHFVAQVTGVGFVRVSGPYYSRLEKPHTNFAVIELTGKGDYATPDLDLNICPSE